MISLLRIARVLVALIVPPLLGASLLVGYADVMRAAKLPYPVFVRAEFSLYLFFGAMWCLIPSMAGWVLLEISQEFGGPAFLKLKWVVVFGAALGCSAGIAIVYFEGLWNGQNHEISVFAAVGIFVGVATATLIHLLRGNRNAQNHSPEPTPRAVH